MENSLRIDNEKISEIANVFVEKHAKKFYIGKHEVQDPKEKREAIETFIDIIKGLRNNCTSFGITYNSNYENLIKTYAMNVLNIPFGKSDEFEKTYLGKETIKKIIEAIEMQIILNNKNLFEYK